MNVKVTLFAMSLLHTDIMDKARAYIVNSQLQSYTVWYSVTYDVTEHGYFVLTHTRVKVRIRIRVLKCRVLLCSYMVSFSLLHCTGIIAM